MKLIVNKTDVISYEDVCNNLEYKGWRIAIPSYKRENTLKNKTLSMLMRNNIDPSKIDVFVADEYEKEKYQRTLKSGTYGRIIVGEVGMMAIRNYIQSFYDEGQRVVCLDDDLNDIVSIDRKQHWKKVEKLSSLFDYIFTICDESGARYWGIYAAANNFFMSRTIGLGLYYIIGSCWGMVVSHEKSLYVTMDDKEDFERSVRAYRRFGRVARMNFITVKSNYYGEEGGMQVERTEERVESSGRKLMAMFPDNVVRNTARKKHFEVKLVEKRERFKALAKFKLNMI